LAQVATATASVGLAFTTELRKQIAIGLAAIGAILLPVGEWIQRARGRPNNGMHQTKRWV
jgi:hypothetical protein